MSHPLRHGIPPTRMLLAPTALTASRVLDRVTIVPLIPLVPVREQLVAALAADDSERDIIWVDLPETPADDPESWAAVDAALTTATGSTALGDPRAAVTARVAALDRDLLLVLAVPAGVSHTFDARMLELLEHAPRLSIAAVIGQRRLLESLGRSVWAARVITADSTVLDAEGIRSYAHGLGFALSAADADALARTPLALPDVLPAVLGLAVDEAAQSGADLVEWLIAECDHFLATRARAADDLELARLLPLTVPTMVTTSALSLADPTGSSGINVARATLAGVLVRGPGEDGHRLQPGLRRVLLAELRERFPERVRALDDALARDYAGRGQVYAAIEHFSAAQNWDDVVRTLDDQMLRLLAGDRARLLKTVAALPKAVLERHPHLALCTELDWRSGENLGPVTLTITRRAAGTFALLPTELGEWDRAHLLLLKTMSARLKGDYVAALTSAEALDLLLDHDALAQRPLDTLAEARYQSGLSRLLCLDLVGARASFALSFEFAQLHGGSENGTAVRAAGAAALVRALEGEAPEALGWLAKLDGVVLDTAGLVARALLAIGRLDSRDVRHWLARLAESGSENELWPFVVHATNRFGLYWGDPVETEGALDRIWAEHGEHLTGGTTAHSLLTSDAADLAMLVGHLSQAESALTASTVRTTWIVASRARLALLTGNPKHALLHILEGQGRGRIERFGQLDLAVLRAAAELALGRREEATASMLRAMKQADKSGLVVPFQLLLADTLGELAALHPDAAEFIQRHGLTGTNYHAPYQRVAGALSDRELVVLRALNPGATVEQVATKLFVASNTVKAQLRSIYRKLNVSTRTEALLVAAELGLLDEDSRSA